MLLPEMPPDPSDDVRVVLRTGEHVFDLVPSGLRAIQNQLVRLWTVKVSDIVGARREQRNGVGGKRLERPTRDQSKMIEEGTVHDGVKHPETHVLDDRTELNRRTNLDVEFLQVLGVRQV